MAFLAFAEAVHVIDKEINPINDVFAFQELDDILKFGTEELFKEEESLEKEAQEKGEETSRIVYDMDAVEKLCDRSQESQVEREEAMNEYLDSFKVATYTVKEGEEVK